MDAPAGFMTAVRGQSGESLNGGASKPGRIVLVTMFKEGFGGGAGRIAHELAHHLSARHKVLLLSPGEETRLSEDGSGLTILTVASSGDDEIRFPSLGRKSRDRVFAALDQFRPDIVHAHDPAFLGALSQAWARKRHVPFVLTLHYLPERILGFCTTESVPLRPEGIVRPIINMYQRSFYRHCDGIVANNQSVVHSLFGFGSPARLFLIPNGCDLQRFSSCQAADLSNKTRDICFVGYLTERKNQLYLLDVLKHLPAHYRLQFIGKPLVPEFERRLRDRARKMGLDNVQFLGQVDYAAIPSYLERAHAFVSASRLEVQSLAIIEALASGTPVVGLANETVDEFVDESVGCRLAREAPPAEFAAWVERICSLPQSEYTQMCQRARARVEDLDWDLVVNATVDAYEILLAGHAAKPATPRARGGSLNRHPLGSLRDFLSEEARPLVNWANGRCNPSAPAWLYAGSCMGLSSILYLLNRYWRASPSS